MNMATGTSTVTLQQTLRDYDIHLTGNKTSTKRATASQTQQREAQNPPDWPEDQHRIPPYRPINRNLDWEERPGGAHPVEQVFIGVMFTGVVLNSSAAQLWGATGGKVFKRVFRYAVGGEW